MDASNAGDALRGLIPGYLGHAADAVAMYLNDARTLSNIALSSKLFSIYSNPDSWKSSGAKSTRIINMTHSGDL